MLLIAGTIGEGLRGPTLPVPSGHEVIGSYLCDSTHKVESSTGDLQPRCHLVAGIGPAPPRGAGCGRGIGKACGWKHPRPPPSKRCLRTTEAVLTFLRDIKVGRVVTRQEEGEVVEGEDPRNVPFFCLWCMLPLSFLGHFFCLCAYFLFLSFAVSFVTSLGGAGWSPTMMAGYRRTGVGNVARGTVR